MPALCPRDKEKIIEIAGPSAPFSVHIKVEIPPLLHDPIRLTSDCTSFANREVMGHARPSKMPILGNRLTCRKPRIPLTRLYPRTERVDASLYDRLVEHDT